MSRKERFRRYREFVYEVGALDAGKGKKIDPKVMERGKKKNYQLTRADRFLYRSRYFTDSGIIGSKAFFVQMRMQKNFQRVKWLFKMSTIGCGSGCVGWMGFIR